MDLISTLRYAAKRKKKEEAEAKKAQEAASKEASEAAESDAPTKEGSVDPRDGEFS